MIKILALAPYAFPEQIASTHLDNNLGEAYDKASFIRTVYAPFPCRGISDKDKEQYRKRKTEILHNGLETIHRFRLYYETRGTLSRAFRYLLCCIIHYFKGCYAKDAKTCNLIMVGSTPPIQGAMAALVKISGFFSKCRLCKKRRLGVEIRTSN